MFRYKSGLKQLLLCIIIYLIFTECINSQSKDLIPQLKSIHTLGKSNPQKALIELNSFFNEISEKDTLAYIKACKMKGNYLSAINKDSSLYYFKLALRNAEKFNKVEDEVDIKRELAIAYKEMNEFSKSDSVYQSLIFHNYYKVKPQGKIKLYSEYASLQLRIQNLENALKYLNEAIEIAEKLNYHNDDRYIYNILSQTYALLKNWQKVIEYNKKLSEHFEKDNKFQYSIMNTIGAAYMSLNELDSASYFFGKVQKGNPPITTKMYSYQYLANISNTKGDYDKGLLYADSCIFIAKQLMSEKEQCACEYQRCGILNKLGKYKESKQLFDRISSCIDMYHKLALGNTLQYYQSDNLLHLEKKPHIAKIVDNIIAERDSIRAGNIHDQLLELETKYQTVQKEAANKLLTAEKKIQTATIRKQQMMIAGLGLGLTGLIFGLFMLHKRSKERQSHIVELAAKNRKIEALNRETIHRTKNYLHLATALITKDKAIASDPNTAQTLEENEKRLRVLSMINNKLSSAEEKTDIPIKEYLLELIDDLEFSFNQIKQKNSLIKAKIEDVILDSDKSLYLGLIINELIVNSFKHAHPREDKLLIDIDIVKNPSEGLTILYKDNGLISDDHKLKEPSQGMNLIKDLFDQLKGRYSHEFGDGYRFEGVI
ncbi:MAG: histidine kinase dimerization/phosphoacceptor domain -containing protein [Saprospiraceae bacterium]